MGMLMASAQSPKNAGATDHTLRRLQVHHNMHQLQLHPCYRQSDALKMDVLKIHRNPELLSEEEV